jgi:hypothetical protein
VDAKGTPEQQQALLKVFNGELGVAIRRCSQVNQRCPYVRVAPIEYNIHQGKGTIKMVMCGE